MMKIKNNNCNANAQAVFLAATGSSSYLVLLSLVGIGTQRYGPLLYTAANYYYHLVTLHCMEEIGRCE